MREVATPNHFLEADFEAFLLLFVLPYQGRKGQRKLVKGVDAHWTQLPENKTRGGQGAVATVKKANLAFLTRFFCGGSSLLLVGALPNLGQIFFAIS